MTPGWLAAIVLVLIVALGVVLASLLGPVGSSCRDDATRVWRQGPRVIQIEPDPNCRYGG